MSARALLPALALLALAACRSTGPAPEPPRLPNVPETRIPLGMLADRLGLRVARDSAARVLLTNEANTVSVFPASGQIYVNGRSVGPVAGMQRSAGDVLVPPQLEDRLRPALRPLPAPAAAPPPLRPPEPVPAPGPAPVRDLVGARIAIDAGHGGHDPGAIAVTGGYEKTVNLLVARRVTALLSARGAEVLLTRSGDGFVELEERAAMANRAGVRLFVSLHSDASPSATTRGFTVYVARQASAGSLAAAREIVNALSESGLASRGVRQADFRVLVKTKMPAALVEMGFLSNFTEARLLFDASHQEGLARALATGIGRAIAKLR